MRFRGVINDPLSLREFSNTINALSKIGRQGTVFLTPTTVKFIIFDEGIPRRPLAQCTLKKTNFFGEYTVVGISQEFNQICLQFATDLLARATSTMKTSVFSESLKIKLAKKNKPCLTCEIKMTTLRQHSRVCIHDIGVEVIHKKNWPDFQLPTLPPFDVSICTEVQMIKFSVKMPSLKRLKIICEKMKFLGTQILLEVTTSGTLILKIETNLASVGIYFYNTTIVKHPEGCSKDDHFGVSFDLKKIIGFLSIEQLNPNNVICNILNQKLILMEVIHENVALHYLITGTLIT